MSNNRKVVLVGTGMVGMSMAYAILNQGGVKELVLIDVMKDKAVGEAMDLSHGLCCAPTQIDIKAGEYSDCKDADIVVITAGKPQKQGGQTRLELAHDNALIMKDITTQVVASGFKGVFVIASNPVDLMAYVVQKVSGFPENKVIGSGTALDTARLRYLIGEKLDISPKNIHAYIMGEHGDSSFACWSHSYVGCKTLYDVIKDKGGDWDTLNSIHEQVKNAAYQIIERKNATYYGIGMELAKIIRVILNDENEILTVSSYLNNNYGHTGMYIGVPAVVGKDGVKEVMNLYLPENERKLFDKSYSILEEAKGIVDAALAE